ncbi:MarR family winged helix-turn-helix transcriptional regulator [Demequina sp. B12]|uniref:MarR family winged helix-turn-helix transcriptional regulator n=1 Tax=Demequina sp. B12 TaxID=2992757 RepID=UPI00237B6995|nr:MarR family winged helix-turn-helix transcriptional regulator [Demequina sp. B12]MDE0572191.1 MarR family winged helix-turn-helix transcriptional regulator [Demequina sp. B12]
MTQPNGTTDPHQAQDTLVQIDTALLRLRRFLSKPVERSHEPAAERAELQVDLSTVLVVDAVSRANSDDTAPTVTAIGAQMAVTASTATRLIDRAAHAGMVTRQPSPTDARATHIVLTAQGHQLDAQALQFRLGHLAAILDDWTPDDIARFATDLTRFAHHASSDTPPRTAPTPHGDPT